MKTSPISVLVLVATLVLATGLSACGRNGAPRVPSGPSDSYPDQYPQSTKPQSDIFSG